MWGKFIENQGVSACLETPVLLSKKGEQPRYLRAG